MSLRHDPEPTAPGALRTGAQHHATRAEHHTGPVVHAAAAARVGAAAAGGLRTCGADQPWT
ncbi:hypothetical protein AMK13_23900 [Streptomyces sp. CB02056]|nr:hypothetical protein AMK13_23900 [Streptomyces sp. CB02056]